jgi:hypothetical protein
MLVPCGVSAAQLGSFFESVFGTRVVDGVPEPPGLVTVTDLSGNWAPGFGVVVDGVPDLRGPVMVRESPRSGDKFCKPKPSVT